MVSPAAHTPYFCATFSYWRWMFACQSLLRNVGAEAELLRL
jgi:hypothetical protein